MHWDTAGPVVIPEHVHWDLQYGKVPERGALGHCWAGGDPRAFALGHADLAKSRSAMHWDTAGPVVIPERVHWDLQYGKVPERDALGHCWVGDDPRACALGRTGTLRSLK